MSNNQATFGKNKYPQLPPSESPFGNYQDYGRNELQQKENKQIVNNSFRNNSNMAMR